MSEGKLGFNVIRTKFLIFQSQKTIFYLIIMTIQLQHVLTDTLRINHIMKHLHIMNIKIYNFCLDLKSYEKQLNSDHENQQCAGAQPLVGRKKQGAIPSLPPIQFNFQTKQGPAVSVLNIRDISFISFSNYIGEIDHFRLDLLKSEIKSCYLKRNFYLKQYFS